MKLINLWNKLSDVLVDILKVCSMLLLVIGVILIFVNLFTEGVNDNVYKYCAIVLTSVYLNAKLNGV